MNKYITDFLEYCELEKGLSPRTISNYDHYLKRFFEWEKISTPGQINEEKVKHFRLRLNRFTDEHGGALKRVTQNYHLISLRAFLKYLARHNVRTLSAEKIELPKTDRSLPQFLEADELDRLLAAPLSLKTSARGNNTFRLAHERTAVRDRAILELLFSTGLRISELCALNRDSINLKRDEFTVRGKGRKLRVVFISHTAKEAARIYLQKRDDEFPALFIPHDPGANKIDNNRSPRLTPRTVQRLIHKYALAAGITKPITPHTLRHTFATDLLMNGADIRSVQAMLGHASITTTQIYTHITNQQLRDVHRAFHGRRRNK